MSYRIGVDIGGTFTDLVISGPTGQLLWKESSTPHRPEEAIVAGLGNAAAELGLTLEGLLGECELFVHGSTIAINAIIQRNGPRVGLLCTDGFRDVLALRDGFKPARYDAHLPHPGAFVDRHLRLGVAERTGPDGAELTALDEDDVRAAARSMREQGVEAVAVALLWAHVNADHERRVRELLAEELPGVPVLLSSEILPETGEWVRTSTTVISAYVFPVSMRYLTDLRAALEDGGLREPLHVMCLNGGCSSVEHTLRMPVNAIGSGPAAAPGAAGRAAERIDARDLIVTDMGGTSFDVCLVKDRGLPISRALTVADQPIGVPGVEIHSIGAGGGSIGWIDSGGALRVGPRSAGSVPGPAAYGAGGVEPTVTDANIVLGYLSGGGIARGRRTLDRELAAAAVRTHLAEPLGVDEMTAAAGMIRVVNESMVDAIGVVSVQRGIDPASFVLVASGGAGALHAGRLAAALGVERVLIPAEAGTLSAFGMTSADVRHDHTRPLYVRSDEPRAGEVRALVEAVEAEAREALLAEGFADDQVATERLVDARYHGQVHELITPVPAGGLEGGDFAAVVARFHDLHAERYGWSRADYPVEFLHWRVAARGSFGRPEEPRFAPVAERTEAPAATRSRRAYFDERGGYVETPVHLPDEIPAGATLRGPAIVDGATTTIVVYPGQRLVAGPDQSFVLELEADAGGEGAR